MNNRPYDLLIFGATSFVGQLLVKYLAQTYGWNQDVTWTMAGRSERKLQHVRDDLSNILGEQAAQVTYHIGNADNEAHMRALCQQARVVVSTVGPYALYGELMVKACAETGTHYCDLTGEPQWIAAMIARYEQQAKASGARIVHCCGFDSVPSDMGVWFTHQHAKQQHQSRCQTIDMRVKAAKGGASGGTIASAIHLIEAASRDANLRKQLSDPYVFCGKDHPLNGKQVDLHGAAYDKGAKAWRAPFVMAGINTRVVHRSNALQQAAYGEDFLYTEAMLTGKGLAGRMRAYAVVFGVTAFMVLMAFSPTRKALKRALPQPGDGPTPDEQANGFFDIRFNATLKNGTSIKTKVTGDRDPGYGSTCKMLGEAAVCLAKDVTCGEHAQTGGGFFTPASLLSEAYIKRLEKNAGLTFDVL